MNINNMDNILFFMGLGLFILFTIVVHFKFNSMKTKIKKLQKHILYVNGMIEKHSSDILALKGESSENSNTNTKIDLLDELEIEDLDEIDEEKPKTKEEPKQQENQTQSSPSPSPSPTPVLQTILPLVSSMMTLMNNQEPESSIPTINVQHEIPTIENEDKDNSMIEEIQSELDDLKNKPLIKEDTEKVEVVN